MVRTVIFLALFVLLNRLVSQSISIGQEPDAPISQGRRGFSPAAA